MIFLKKVLTDFVIYGIILVIGFILSIILRLGMKKRSNKHYQQDHKLAKLICAIINTILLIVVLDIDKPFLFFIINLTYFFGANTIAFCLETIRGHKHKHDII